jgi:hypothetical protein
MKKAAASEMKKVDDGELKRGEEVEMKLKQIMAKMYELLASGRNSEHFLAMLEMEQPSAS